MLAFDRHTSTYDRHAVVQRAVASRLAGLLPEGLSFGKVLEFGCGTGFLTESLLKRVFMEELELNDLSMKMLQIAQQKISPLLSNKKTLLHLCPGSVERLYFSNYDLIGSASVLQWIESPFALLSQISKRLLPGGHLLIATYGGKNLKELRQLSRQGLSYLSKGQLEDFLVQCGLHVQECFEEETCLYFPDIKALLQHLKKQERRFFLRQTPIVSTVFPFSNFVTFMKIYSGQVKGFPLPTILFTCWPKSPKSTYP